MSLNTQIFYFFNHAFQNPVFDAIMPFWTELGSFEFIFFLVIAILIYAYIKNNETLKNIMLLSLISLLLSGFFVVLLKNGFQEPRPFMSLDNVHLLVNETDPNSFPSGHTSSTFAVVTFVLLNIGQLVKKHTKLVSICLIIFAISIPFSRMYVGVHYPGDVLIGGIFGLASAFVVNHFKEQILSIIRKLNNYKEEIL